MTLRQKLDDDLKEAMRAKDSVRMETIRSVKSAILLKETQGGAVDDPTVIQIVRSLIKQREDSIEQYQLGGRQDLVEKETREKELLSNYVPAAPDAATVERTVREAITELSATSMRDMGKVMQAVTSKLGPSVDTKAVSQVVKSLLNK